MGRVIRLDLPAGVWPGVRRAGLPRLSPPLKPGAAQQAPRLTRAARIYLHAREERERQLAVALDKMARRELKASAAKRTAARSGT